jgi:hypothetical protein
MLTMSNISRRAILKKDHFQAYLLKGANLTGKWEFPKLKPCHEVPEKLIPFSKTKGIKNFNQFVHFYELDEKILPFDNHPRTYFRRLSNFKGVIGPDFSVYRDMPLFKQIGQVSKNCILTFWLQSCNLISPMSAFLTSVRMNFALKESLKTVLSRLVPTAGQKRRMIFTAK